MLIKYGVNPVFNSFLISQFDDLDRIFWEIAGRECIITSADDGQHMYGSLHYKKLAIDLRTNDLSEKVKKKIHKALVDHFGEDWDIILEKTHIHCEYDPKF